MKRLVSDTGPILHLREAGALHRFPLIGNIFLPPLVMTELRFHLPALWSNALPEWVGVHTLSSRAQQQSLSWRRAGILHIGEAEALALANQIQPDWFLTDEAAARLVAESLGIEVHGSIGIVLWVAGQKLISQTEAEKCLDGLEESSLWMSQKVRAAAREALSKLTSG